MIIDLKLKADNLVNLDNPQNPVFNYKISDAFFAMETKKQIDGGYAFAASALSAKYYQDVSRRDGDLLSQSLSQVQARPDSIKNYFVPGTYEPNIERYESVLGTTKQHLPLVEYHRAMKLSSLQGSI